MRETTEAAAVLIRASLGTTVNGSDARPVECLSTEAMSCAFVLAAAGFGTLTFTANREGAAALDRDGETSR